MSLAQPVYYNKAEYIETVRPRFSLDLPNESGKILVLSGHRE